MTRSAGDSFRRNEELWATGETVGESPGHAGCWCSEWKKPDIHHRALPSCDRFIGKTYGFCRWARNKGTLVESGGERWQAVCLTGTVRGMQRKGETCQLRSIGGHVNAGSAGGRTPADDSAVGFRRAVAVTVGFGRYGCVTREFLLYSRGRAILGHPTPVRMRKC